LILSGLFLAARRLWTWSVIPGNFTVSEGHEDELDHPASAVRALAMMGLCVLWATLLRPVGFLIVTPIVIAIMLWLMEVREIRRLAAFSLLFTFGLWLAFSEILGIVLPYGPLTGLARSWGLIY
jgi:putative tricarboxylic transport membrane protein